MKKLINRIGRTNLIIYTLVIVLIIFGVWYNHTPAKQVDGFLTLDKAFIEQENYLTIVNLWDCEYVLMKVQGTISLTHKGNCKNPAHNK